jgi:hypothetical protein
MAAACGEIAMRLIGETLIMPSENPAPKKPP